MSRETDLAYLAGLIDGEGSITITQHQNHKTTFECRPRVTILSNTNAEIVAEVERILKVEAIPYYVRTNLPRKDQRNKVMYHVYSDGYRRALKTLWILEPHLRIKGRQGRMVLAFAWSRVVAIGENGKAPYTEDELSLVHGVRELNQTGSEILREHTLRAEEISVKICSELRTKGGEVSEMDTRLANSYHWRGQRNKK